MPPKPLPMMTTLRVWPLTIVRLLRCMLVDERSTATYPLVEHLSTTARRAGGLGAVGTDEEAMTHINGQVAVVTGAGSGIGRALALTLAGRGCALGLSDIRGTRLDETARACADRGAPVHAERVDVTDRGAVAAHAAAVVRRFGRVNLVFNNAGVGHAADANDQSFADIERMIDVNFWGVVNGSQLFLPHLIASGDGHLVNLSSLFGLVAAPAHSAYNASKFAVRGYTEALALDLAVAREPVRVSCVHPGGVATNIARDASFGAAGDQEALVALFDRLARTSATDAARVIVRGVERNRIRILVGADARVLTTVAALAGGRSTRLLAWMARRHWPRPLQDQPSSPSTGKPAAANTDRADSSSSTSRAARDSSTASARNHVTTTSSTKAM
jgi:NADP-dependent 3-hydroxy acid dehydrogenase YdfG